MGIKPGAWDHFGAPVLFLTGTKDYGQGERPAAWRRSPFEAIKQAGSVDDYLLTITDARHMTFGNPNGLRGRGDNGVEHKQSREEDLIDAMCAAFFDAYVCGDAKAKEWLQGFFKAEHKDCAAEFSTPRP